MSTVVKAPPLYALQHEIATDRARFKVISAGRRSGKTRLGVWLCIETAVKGGVAWWIAPTYKVANVGWRLLKRLAMQLPGAIVSESTRAVFLPTGGWVQIRSGDDPDSLRGESLDLVVIDEAAYVKERAWAEALRPALSDREGKAVFISTPAGKNYFYRLWLMGQDEAHPEWKSWKFPTAANPFIKAIEIERARGDLTADIFRQEYTADFIDDGGVVFRGVRRAISEQRPPTEGNPTVAGIDWGQSNDFTAIAVLDVQERRLLHLDAFNRLEWRMQRDRVKAAFDRFGVSYALVEANSIGGPQIEELLADGMPVRAWMTTNESKNVAVQALALAFEKQELTLYDSMVLVNELEAFEAHRLPSGRWTYGAPDGMHDDTVIALALAWQASMASGGGISFI